MFDYFVGLVLKGLSKLYKYHRTSYNRNLTKESIAATEKVILFLFVILKFILIASLLIPASTS